MIIHFPFFSRKKTLYRKLASKWQNKQRAIHEYLIAKHGETIGKALHQLSTDQIKAGTLGSLMIGATLINTPANSNHTKLQNNQQYMDINTVDRNAFLVSDLSKVVPEDIRPLTSDEETTISELFLKYYGIPTKAELNGIRLNMDYGIIGGEQHLYRYPGDVLANHAENVEDQAMYGPAGIAPGLGAWGYFAPSESQFSKLGEQRERWYIAVQTFLAPSYNTSTYDYYHFFKYRKMLVVNPQTGQAVVADIGDSGPAEWTGKHLGGSPEVMQAIGLADGPRKGAVLYFFVNDPNDTIPLGPVQIKQ